MYDRYVGVILALSSGIFIGSSFIITKLGLMEAQKKRGGRAGEGYNYLQNVKWWLGMVTMVLGEVANFAAYTYAPAILVTPLGAVSVFVSAVLAAIFLNERLGFEGQVGCVLCVIGSVIIILHAPEDPKVDTVDEFLDYAMNFGFLFYSLLVSAVSVFLIYKVAPQFGRENMLVYVAICSLVGSISVMACKGFGIALRITFSGSNQFKYFSTYFFGFIVGLCAITQMNYLNKALDIYSTNRVTPVYYVFFSTATIIASVLLFRGFNNTSGRDVVSILCGFLSIFLGVVLVNSNKVQAEEANASNRSRNMLTTGHRRVRSSSRAPEYVEFEDTGLGLSGNDVVIDDLPDDMLDDMDADGTSYRTHTTPATHNEPRMLQNRSSHHGNRVDYIDDAVDSISDPFAIHDRGFMSPGVRGGETLAMKTFDDDS